MKGLKGVFIFAAGLVTGAVAGAYLVKDKVLADAREEINEVREYYKSKKEDKNEVEEINEEELKRRHEEAERCETNAEKEEYQEVTKKYTNYTNYSDIEQPVVDKVLDVNDPYVIDPEEFGEEEEYDTMTLTYFADGVLIDDVDNVIDEPDPVVGLDNLKIFDEFGASSIYVRNDVWKTDFEILKDDWNYSDIQEPSVEKKPHQL